MIRPYGTSAPGRIANLCYFRLPGSERGIKESYSNLSSLAPLPILVSIKVLQIQSLPCCQYTNREERPLGRAIHPYYTRFLW